MPVGQPDPGRNRRVLAERLGYPDGALAACIDIENEHPSWIVYWTRGGAKPAGFYAFRSGPWSSTTHLYGATPDALREAINSAS